MQTKSVVQLAHSCCAASRTYQTLVQLMCTNLSFPCSQRYNSKYNQFDMHNALISLCIGNQYAESGMKRLAVESSLSKTPSGSLIRDTISKIHEQQMKQKVHDALDSTVSNLQDLGMFRKQVMVAIDKHHIPRYDKKPEPFLLRSRYQNGTDKFETYITIQCVEQAARAQIGCHHVTFLDNNPNLVRKLLTDCTKNGIRTSLVLLDREFFSVGVISQLKKMHCTFLMPCTKRPAVKEALQEHLRGERRWVSECTITTYGGKSESFTLVIVPKRDSNDPDPLNRYVVFATNISSGKILRNIWRIPQDYKRRWGIETGYVGVEKFRPRTTSRNHSIRLLYFYYSLILFNAWIIANRHAAKDLSHIDTKPVISIELLKGIFRIMIIKNIQGNDNQNYFLECIM